MTDEERSEYESELCQLEQTHTELEDALAFLEYHLNDDPEDEFAEREYDSLCMEERSVVREIKYIRGILKGERDDS